MPVVSNWDKFRLLLWKNWILQKNQKVQLAIELLLPAIFSLLLVFVRIQVNVEEKGVTIYPEINITDLSLFHKIKIYAKMKQSIVNEMLSKEKRDEFKENPLQPMLLYSPNTSLIFQNIVSEATKQLKLKPFKGFANAADLEVALMKDNYLAGIQFDDRLANINKYPEKLSYALRFPSVLRNQFSNFVITFSWTTNKLFPIFGKIGPRNPTADDGGIPVGYLREGFLPIQNAISSAYLRLAGNVDNLPNIRMQRYPYPPFIDDQLLEGLPSMMSLIIVLSFTYPCTYITKYITTEKEKQLKEVMKIMGLQNWIHWTAWLVKSFIMLGSSATLIMIFIKIRWNENVAVLTHSDWTVLLFFLLIYVITSICFCFMLAVFFSKANTAAAVTGLIWFIAYLPYLFLINKYDDLTLTSKLAWSLLGNTAMGFGLKVIMGFEASGEGLQWENLFSTISPDDDLTIAKIIIVMLISCVVYMIICLYVEQIFPGDFGVPKKWNFPFDKKFWFNSRVNYEYYNSGDTPHIERQNPEAFEVEPTGKHVGLQVINLQRKFGNKMAVKGITMNMYEDEITVLLGHNGAGKTTTISMITGMIPPTGGTAIINGSDIRTNIEGARMSMGICPQHNVLFDDLTVTEHLIFFSRLKGLTGEAVKMEVDKYLKMIELEDKANVVSSKLSGGMKRKLSICSAFCGGSQVVVCDEPSSGMDPAARRQLWDLLLAEKAGRTVLLTTHFMDEADVLGDRIAIMRDGELRCLGRTFFLKKIYGSGYKLICVKRENCNTVEVTRLLQQFIPDIQPESEIGAELNYRLPDSASPYFEEMFAALELNSDELDLSGYGVSITPLEEVFMKVGAENIANGTAQIQPVDDLSSGTATAANVLVQNDTESITYWYYKKIFAENNGSIEGFRLFCNQWSAMIQKKYLYSLRNKFLFFLQNFMPVFFVIVTILIGRTRGRYNELVPMTVKLSQYPKAIVVLERDNNIEDNSLESKIAEYYEAISNCAQCHFELTGDKNFTAYILNLGKTMQVRIDSSYVAAASIAKGSIIAWLNNQPLHTAPLTVNLIHNAMAKALLGSQHEIEVTNAPLPFTAQNRLQQLNVGNNLGTQLATNLCFSMCFVSAFYILFLIKERESRSKLLQFVGGVKVWTFWLSHYLWDYITYVVTAIIMIITLATYQETCYSTFEELARNLLMFLLFGLSALPFTYIISMWFSEPAIGFARYAIINVFAGMALFVTVTVMSFEVFDLKDVADLLKWFFRIVPHFSLAQSMNSLYANTYTRKICEPVRKEFYPFYDIMCEKFPQCCNDVAYFGMEPPGVLPEVIYLIVTALLFFMIVIIKEYRIVDWSINSIRQRFTEPPPPPAEGYFEEAVANEREYVKRMSSDELQIQNLVLDRVTKYYGKFLAVNQVSVCVRHSECFGLLGVNGAGKTTTFKMMIGDERISFGDAYVKGMNLNSKMGQVYKVIGYCPQFDALLDDLTGREMLKIFCLLRGIPKTQIHQISMNLAKSFGFERHLDKQTRAYSGGNKRKLSTAIAVIGSPLVIYLDEPTTGMDPAARRQLWNMVCRIRDSGKSIVLTSHSMEECEALCTRLAIMVNGEFKCLGSTQQLKNKFSKGIILKIKIKRNQEEMESSKIIDVSGNSIEEDKSMVLVKEFVEEEIENSILQEQYQGMLTFYIPLSSITWSRIFGLIESNKEILNIEDYSVSQTTLEEIFLEFAKHQREDTRLTKKRKHCPGLCCCLKRRDSVGEGDGREATQFLPQS